MATGSIVIVGGTRGIGLGLAQAYAERGRRVIITGRDRARTETVAASITGEGAVESRAFDLAEPERIQEGLSGIDRVDHLVLAAIERDQNKVREYDVAAAVRLVTLKLVGYSAVVHALAPRLTEDSSILIFGGMAKSYPYPGSTTVTTVNAGVCGLVRTLAAELAPVRVNGIHPGIVGDTPEWSAKPAAVLDAIRARTPIGRLATTEDVVGAAVFLLENRAVNGVNLEVHGGWMLV